jgi:hypothetical protein
MTTGNTLLEGGGGLETALSKAEVGGGRIETGWRSGNQPGARKEVFLFVRNRVNSEKQDEIAKRLIREGYLYFFIRE